MCLGAYVVICCLVLLFMYVALTYSYHSDPQSTLFTVCCMPCVCIPIYVFDNKVRELATACLSWQHWTKALVWFDVFDISAFHSCVVVVDLWHSLSEWHLLLSACVLVCRRGMSELELEQRTNIKFLVVS